MRAVGNLRVAATTITSITLAWDPPGGPIQADGYLIVLVAGRGWRRGKRCLRDDAPVTHFRGLATNTQYFFYVWPQSGALRSKGPMSFIYASTQ